MILFFLQMFSHRFYYLNSTRYLIKFYNTRHRFPLIKTFLKHKQKAFAYLEDTCIILCHIIQYITIQLLVTMKHNWTSYVVKMVKKLSKKNIRVRLFFLNLLEFFCFLFLIIHGFCKISSPLQEVSVMMVENCTHLWIKREDKCLECT